MCQIEELYNNDKKIMFVSDNVNDEDMFKLLSTYPPNKNKVYGFSNVISGEDFSLEYDVDNDEPIKYIVEHGEYTNDVAHINDIQNDIINEKSLFVDTNKFDALVKNHGGCDVFIMSGADKKLVVLQSVLDKDDIYLCVKNPGVMMEDDIEFIPTTFTDNEKDIIMTGMDTIINYHSTVWEEAKALLGGLLTYEKIDLADVI